ncbi:histone acetyltransferases subunit 3-domain-containing protein [Phycomyces blakesleeanus]|uniref:Histone acetyltransferases subunit 3-domain-containing protein n=1 Tax=Phycomyces blakesleeanus TaxID=4837 RepID=A0ABR3BEB6_PHYBL
MENDRVHQYSPPVAVSASTASQYRHFSSTGPLAAGGIPGPQDLLNIKVDLENLLPEADARLRFLRKDSKYLERITKIRDDKNTHPQRTSPPGANENNVGNSVGKQDQAANGKHVNSNSPKSKIRSEREAALAHLRRHHRRDESNRAKENHGKSQRPDSSHAFGKSQRNKGSRSRSRSMSPLSMPNFPRPSKQPPKPHQGSKAKKRKPDSYKSANQRAPPPPPESRVKEDLGFVVVKPKDQVPVANFWAAVEPCFRPLAEEDRNFLLEQSDNTTPYIIPTLGRPYSELWAEEDHNLVPALSRSHSPALGSSTASSRQGSHDHLANETGAPPERLKYLVSKHSLTDDHLNTQDLSCGSLTERLLSSLIREDIVDPSEAPFQQDADDDFTGVSTGEKDIEMPGKTVLEILPYPPPEIVDFEERLRRELRYAGLLGEDDVDWNSREDDEICAELRKSSRELKEQVAMNTSRKKKLLDIVDRQLQYEQYRHVLDTLDTQVEQCYIKRFRTQKSKKRKMASSSRPSCLSENAVYAMEKRRTWINALGGIFKDKNLIMPTKSIYEETEQG